MRFLRPLLTLLALGGSAHARPATEYAVDPAASEIRVHVGKAGLFKFAGHEHEIVAAPADGRVVADPESLPLSSVRVRIEASAFRVVGEKDASDTPKIQKTMETDVLETVKYPEISFESTKVSGRKTSPGHYALQLSGRLTVHGRGQSVEIPVDVVMDGDSLTAKGHLTITHGSFGLMRVSVGGGAVKVANEIAIDFTLVARAVE